MQALGIDIGGTGIKGAVVDTATGEFVTDRLRIKTPAAGHAGRGRPMSSARSRAHFSWNGPVGVTFPGVVKGGTIHTAANVDPSVGRSRTRPTIFGQATGCQVDVRQRRRRRRARPRRASAIPQARHGVVVLLDARHRHRQRAASPTAC